MNFLAHLYLADPDEGLLLGALLGDFVRGRAALDDYPRPVREGIELHRRVDGFTDEDETVAGLRRDFPPDFRRYAGIVIDLAMDHELARRWGEFHPRTLEAFDGEIRALLARHDALLPPRLRRFMAYADRRGLFAAYREESEIFRSLAGIGTRLSRANPLGRARELWPSMAGRFRAGFDAFFPRLQSMVSDWRGRRSSTTGSWSEALAQGAGAGTPSA